MPSTTADRRSLIRRIPASQITAIAVRGIMLALVTVLILAATRDVAELRWVVLLVLAGLPAVIAPRHRFAAPLGRFAEVILVGLGASAVALAADQVGTVTDGIGAAALLPYLAVPITAAMLQNRPLESAGLLGVATVALAAAGWFTVTPDGTRQLTDVGYIAMCAQWLILAAIGTITTGAMQRAALARRAPQPYAEATRLLTQLRQVARQLPGATLDPGSIAEHLLEELRPLGRPQRAAVFAASGAGRLVVLAQFGVEADDTSTRAAWETSLDSDSAVADAWASQQPQVSGRTQLRSREQNGPVSALVVPLVAGVRTVGLVALERDGANGYPQALTNRIVNTATPAALRLEAALLFEEVRSIATNEERQRLAREIHDGVAQELVMIGYGVDNAQATLPEGAEDTAEELRVLRSEITRVITELRLSLFELRSEVDRHGGLTAAIAEFARISGNQAGLKVNLSLDEAGRLPASIESELLRIAQEAITNARKHAAAANLWVTCTVDPPYGLIEVSDDGQGIPDERTDGRYGLAIMAERAERIRGRLEIRPRDPVGTTVAVVVGGSPRQDTRATR
ncbi:sensor histidine kinase [Catellatospora tritici]|uniref:sensor histidine kinase n=1 Tax=Catellatospora tritici TaxID=2851566 RepID=UPI001C2CECAD|nr:histidine kinase [Catellatospora tritici]MBV1852533.1 GAF domain-containing protein [Catellatospora tritici]